MTVVTFSHRMMTHLSFHYDLNEKRKQYSIKRTMEMEIDGYIKDSDAAMSLSHFLNFVDIAYQQNPDPKSTHKNFCTIYFLLPWNDHKFWCQWFLLYSAILTNIKFYPI